MMPLGPRSLWPIPSEDIAAATRAELESERQWLAKRLEAVQARQAETGPAPRRWNVLGDLIEANSWLSGAEVGVFRGATFLALLRRFHGLSLIGVDPWKAGGRHDMHAYCREVTREAAQFGPRARLLRTTSLEAAPQVPDASLDFVFIDANHGEKWVREDIQAWHPKVRPGGWLMGHDCNLYGVRAAIDDLCPGWAKHECVIWSLPV